MAASAQSLQNSTTGLILRIWQSSLGKKYIMAITGLGLFLFVVVHMIGNLQIFIGRDQINDYAMALKSHPMFLWTARIGLLAVATLHIVTAIQLAHENRRARPVAYSDKKVVASTFANRTIVIGGLLILAFIVFHLLHFTIGWIDPDYLRLRDSMGRHDVYQMVINGFSNPFVSILYIFSMGFLMLHLSHGVSSVFQSLGLRNKKNFGFFDKLAKISAILIFIGNSSIPLAVLAGIIK
jgi:succinate dehydrogenase / fumarate reductase cytochrome b subunit